MNKLKKFSVVSIMFLTIFFTLGTKSMATDISNMNLTVEYSDRFKKYLQLPPEEQAKVMQPMPYEIPKPEEKINTYGFMLKLSANMERSYTLADAIPNNMEIRNQGETNACWTFANLAMLETNLALTGSDKTKVYDFSERHMEYATCRFFANDQINEKGFDRRVNSGGTPSMAIAYLTNGEGAVKEEDMPFEDKLDTIDIEELQGKEVCSQVYDTVQFPSYSSEDDKTEVMEQIKNHIKNYGAVEAGVYGASLINECYNNDNAAMYCDDEVEFPINHAVAIVGWDDDFSKDNFNEDHRPENNGAWLVKNSWGKTYTIDDLTEIRKSIYEKNQEQFQQQQILDPSQIPDEVIKAAFKDKGCEVDIQGNTLTMNVGKDGFMYISYEDVNIYKQMVGIIKSSDSVDYDNIYQYNMLGSNALFKLGTRKVYIGNIFTKKTSDPEYITQVALETGSTITCKVYVNPNGTNMDKNSLIEAQLKEGETETFDAGYHTIEFSNPIEVTSNDYAVVIEVQGTNVNIGMLENLPSSAYDQVKIEEEKGFIAFEDDFEKNVWTDLATINKINMQIPNLTTSTKVFTVKEVEEEPGSGQGGSGESGGGSGSGSGSQEGSGSGSGSGSSSGGSTSSGGGSSSSGGSGSGTTTGGNSGSGSTGSGTGYGSSSSSSSGRGTGTNGGTTQGNGDNTLASVILPYAGFVTNCMISTVAVIVVAGGIVYIKYRKYRKYKNIEK